MSFNEAILVEKLAKLNSSQQSIETLSHCRKKGPEFVKEYYKVLPRALKHFAKHAGAKSLDSLGRLINIWDERKVFGKELPPEMRAALTTDGSGAKDAEAAPQAARPAGSGPHSAIARALDNVEQEDAADAKLQAAVESLPEELLTEEALRAATAGGSVARYAEQLDSAFQALSEYRTRLEASLTRRDSLIGLLREALHSQEEAFSQAEERLQRVTSQAEKVLELSSAAAKAQPPPSSAPAPLGDPRLEGGEADTNGDQELSPQQIAAALAQVVDAGAAQEAGQVAASLAGMDNPAAVLHDVLATLSAAELNSFGSQLASMATGGLTADPASHDGQGGDRAVSDEDAAPAKRQRVDDTDAGYPSSGMDEAEDDGDDGYDPRTAHMHEAEEEPSEPATDGSPGHGQPDGHTSGHGPPGF